MFDLNQPSPSPQPQPTPSSGYGLRFEKKFSKGGKVSSASSRADGIAQRGKTRGKML
jgi:hypothetical protein